MNTTDSRSQTAVEGFTANCPAGDVIVPGDEVVFTLCSWWHVKCLRPC